MSSSQKRRKEGRGGGGSVDSLLDSNSSALTEYAAQTIMVPNQRHGAQMYMPLAYTVRFESVSVLTTAVSHDHPPP